MFGLARKHSKFKRRTSGGQGSPELHMNIETSDIERCLKTVARLVEAYGDDYWATFERLEVELEERQQRLVRLRKFKRRRKLSAGELE